MVRVKALRMAVVFTALFGAAMVLLPGPTRSGYSLMMFGDAARMDGFGAEAHGYITLLHGVLGAVMIGWAVALWGLLNVIDTAGSWRAVAASVGTWFVIDTGYSMAMAAWPNVALNCAFAAVFALACALGRQPRV
jgi:hypothetical protein